MSISIIVEGRDREEWQFAGDMLKILAQSKPGVKERLGFGSTEIKKAEDFQRQLASVIAEKIRTVSPDDMPLEEFVLVILQLVDEAADEIFGDE